MTYERHWSQAWGLVVAVGVGVGLLCWPPLVVLVLTAVAVALAWMLLMTCRRPATRADRSALPPRQLVATRAALLGGGVAAARGLAELSLPITVVLVCLAVLSSPPVVLWLDDHAARPTHLDAEATARLRAWTVSGLALGAALTDTERLAVVTRRQSMLDAWEELDPAGFAAGLAALPLGRPETARRRADDVP